MEGAMEGELTWIRMNVFDLSASMMGLRRPSVGETSGSDLVVQTTKSYAVSAAASTELTTTQGRIGQHLARRRPRAGGNARRCGLKPSIVPNLSGLLILMPLSWSDSVSARVSSRSVHLEAEHGP